MTAGVAQLTAYLLALCLSASPGLAASNCSLAGSSPASYRMPAEWEPHLRTFIGWPQRPDKQQLPASEAYAAVAQAIAKFEPVVVCAAPDQVEGAKGMLPESIQVSALPVQNSWIRDTGPTFVWREGGDTGGAVAVSWEFDEWGTSDESNHAAASAIAKEAAVKEEHCEVVMEGGAFNVDGEGTLLTTEERFFKHGRKPHASKEEFEGLFRRMLGAKKVIWIPDGLFADTDTGGHIDDMACFARPGVVLLAWTDDTSDPQHKRSARALEVLEGERDAKGRALQVVKVPLPPPLVMTDKEAAGVQETYGGKKMDAGNRIPASYINLYICNSGVVMPAFGEQEADERAKKIIQREFPQRQVVAVPSRNIVVGGGNIHCITQQQPAAPSRPHALEGAPEGGLNLSEL